MRRGTASLILGWSLVIASFAWAGFVLTHTVLDPDRSERLADQMLENQVLRSAVVGRLATSMGSALPAGVPVPRQTLEAAADAALDDPAVERLVVDGLVCTHQNALRGVAEGCTIEASALAQATRSALVATDPALDAVLPEVPAFSITLPDSGLAWMGSVRSFALRVTNIGALIALSGAAVAFLITSDRASVLRRAAWWAFGSAAFWLVISFGLPFLINLVAPSGAAFTVAMIDVFFGAMIGPAIAMAVFGVALLAASVAWRAIDGERMGRAVAGGGHSGARAAQVYVPPQPQPQAPPVRAPSAPRGGSQHVAHGRAQPTENPAPRPQPSADPTAVYPMPNRSSGEPTMRPGKPPRKAERTWVEGVGYVDDD